MDISMCRNIKCKKRLECYRFMAKPNPLYQSDLVIDVEEGCDMFWDISTCPVVADNKKTIDKVRKKK